MYGDPKIEAKDDTYKKLYTIGMEELICGYFTDRIKSIEVNNLNSNDLPESITNKNCEISQEL